MQKSYNGLMGCSAMKRLMPAGVGVLMLSACASWRIQPTAAGPGVPIISNLQVEPAKARVGETVRVTFDFEDTDADVVEAHIFPSEVREWVYRPAFAPKVVSLKTDTYGLAVGKVETTLKWDTEGIKIIEVFVMDERSHTSNALRVRIPVTRR